MKYRYIIEDSQGNTKEYPPDPTPEQYKKMITDLHEIAGSKLHVYKYNQTLRGGYDGLGKDMRNP